MPDGEWGGGGGGGGVSLGKEKLIKVIYEPVTKGAPA